MDLKCDIQPKLKVPKIALISGVGSGGVGYWLVGMDRWVGEKILLVDTAFPSLD